jgi:hypothetical protein
MHPRQELCSEGQESAKNIYHPGKSDETHVGLAQDNPDFEDLIMLSSLLKYLQANLAGCNIPKRNTSQPTELQVGLWSLLLATTLILSLRYFNSFQLGVYQDDASYAVLARSIANSPAYGLINTPGPPLPTRYPFGFPLFLAPVARLFPDSPDLMKVVSLIATLLNASLLFWSWPFLSQAKSYWWGLVVAALATFSPLVIGHTRMVMSEPVFTCFVLMSLILAGKHMANRKRSWMSSVWLGISLTMALFIRTIGVALWVAILVPLAIRLKKETLRTYAGVAAGALVLLLLVLMSTPVGMHDLLPMEYVSQLEDPQSWGRDDVSQKFVPRALIGIKAYLYQHLREAVMPFGGGNRERLLGQRLGIPDLPLVMGVLIASLILLGSLFFRDEKGLSPRVVIFEVLYLLVLVIWPWRGARFLYPIQPFLFYHLLQGIRLIALPFGRMIKFRFSSVGVTLMILAVLAASIYKGALPVDSRLHTRDLRVGTTWLKENTDPDAVVLCQEPQSIYLYAGRKTVGYPPVNSSRDPEQLIQDWDVDYILVAPKLEWREDGSLRYDDFTGQVFIPLLEDLVSRGQLVLVYQSREKDMVKVFQTVRSVD